MWCKICLQICDLGTTFKCTCGHYQSAHLPEPPPGAIPAKSESEPTTTATTTTITDTEEIIVPELVDEETLPSPSSPSSSPRKMKRKKGKQTYARPDGDPIYQSFLKKRHKKHNMKWQRRYFVLYRQALLYYDNEFEIDTDEAKGKLELDQIVKVKFFLSIVGDFMITILLEAKSIDLQAEKKQHWNTWFNIYKKLLGQDFVEKNETVPKAEKERHARPKEEEILFAAYLRKRHKKNHTVWQTRFFVLYNSALLYYDKEEEKGIDHAKGRINSVDINKVSFGGADNKYLEITCSGGKLVVVQAPGRNEMLRWQEHFITMLGADKVEKLDEEKAFFTEGEIIYSGYMKKRSPKNKYVWQVRYYVLTSKALLYYEDDTYKSKKGEISLGDIKTAILHGDECRSVNVLLKSKTHELMAPSATDATRWIDALENIVGSDGITRVATDERLLKRQNSIMPHLKGPVEAAKTPVVFSGTLKKRSPKNKLVWQARFFVLHRVSLLYYETENDRMANKNGIKGQHKCDDIKMVTLHGESGKNIDIECGKLVELAAGSPKEAERWFGAFVKVLGAERTTRALLNKGNKNANVQAPTSPHKPSMLPAKAPGPSTQEYPSDVPESHCDWSYVTKEGLLKKEAPKTMLGLSTFQKRYFALEERGKKGRLCYWKNEKEKKK